MKTSRDLLLLAAVAFQEKKFDDAGALFASALSSDDASEMLEALNKLGNENAEPLSLETLASDSMPLSKIAETLSSAIKEVTASDDEEDEESDSEDEEDEDDEDDSEEEDEEESDEESDDDSEDEGEDEESVSTSSTKKVSTVQRRSGERKLIISGINSPIKLKQ